jgi:flagellar biosynthetic protein FliO
MLQQYIAVFVVLALLFAALWLMRRKGFAAVSLRQFRAPAAGRQMQVVERVSLTAQHSLHLVSLPGRMMVVSVSPGGCNQVALFPSADQSSQQVIS